MSTATGNRLTPARLNPVAFQLQVNATATLTATNTDLSLAAGMPAWPGLSGATYTVPAGGMTGFAVWTGDFQLTTGGGTVTAATLDFVIDGAVPTSAPQAIWDAGNVTDGRVTASASWPFTLTAGAHTFGLRAAAVLTSPAVVKLNARHTNVSIWLHP